MSYDLQNSAKHPEARKHGGVRLPFHRVHTRAAVAFLCGCGETFFYFHIVENRWRLSLFVHTPKGFQ